MDLDLDLVEELTRFAATGRFGAFHVGARLSDVVAAYGEPEWSGRVSAKRRWPHWFGYGSLQPVFCRCRLLSALYIPGWHEELELPGPGGSRPAALPVTEAQLTAAFTGAGVGWRTEWSENLPHQRTLSMEPAPHTTVYFTFWDRHHDEGRSVPDWPLYQAGTSGTGHGPCPEPDRALPDDGYGA